MKTSKLIHRKNITKVPYILLSKISRGEKSYSKPFWVQIEPTTKCNLDCPMCPRKLKSNVNNDMSFKSFKTIIDKLPQTLILNLQGLGEPFLNKDIFKMIEYSKNKGIYVFTITNGNILSKNMNKKIIKSGLNDISFSIDGPTKKSYNIIRKGGDFDKVMDNMRNLNKLRKDMNFEMEIKILALINRKNFDSLEKYIEIAKEVDADKVKLEKIQFNYIPEERNVEPLNLTENQKRRLNEKINKLKDLASRNNVDLSITTEKDCYEDCTWPWEKIYVNYDGSVTPCCNLTSLKIGNILKEI